MEALLLAGGLGTRLRSVLPETPKIIAPIRCRPFVTYILDQLAAAGIERVIICTGYRGPQVVAALGHEYHGLRIQYSEEPYPMGTAGALKYAVTNIAVGGEDILVLNADSYVDTNLWEFHTWHSDNRFTASVLLTQVPDAGRFGTVSVNGQYRIREFNEKAGAPVQGWINAGIYIIPRLWIETLPKEVPLSLERDVLPKWVARELGGYCVVAPFIDIGTPESLASAPEFIRNLPSGVRYEP